MMGVLADIRDILTIQLVRLRGRPIIVRIIAAVFYLLLSHFIFLGVIPVLLGYHNLPFPASYRASGWLRALSYGGAITAVLALFAGKKR